MKKIAIFTLFFYTCTFTSPPQSCSAIPLAVYGIAAVGAACLASSGAGTYYLQSGKTPSYVPAIESAAATVADKMFIPAYLASGAYNVVTKTTFPMAEKIFLAKSAAVGTSIQNILDTVQSSASNKFTSLKNLISACTLPGTNPGTSTLENPTGTIYQGADNQNYIVSSGSWSTATLKTESIARAELIGEAVPVTWIHVYLGQNLTTTGFIGVAMVSGAPRLIRWGSNSYHATTFPGTGTGAYYRWSGALTTTSEPQTYPQGIPGFSADLFKNTVASPPSEIAQDIADVIKETHPSSLTTAASVPATAAAATSAPTLTQAEVNNWFKQNTAEVAQAAADAAAAAAAADPTNAALAQAARDAATAAAQAAENAANPTEEPPAEPNYPVPSTWYTKTCDLSKGLATCINYDQIRTATNSFNNTFIVQFPNLILDCLGYVEGDGCTYPPILTIDFHNRFSNEPIRIDMSPFESVANIMKFFFSLLCLLLTGKSVMYLFQ